MDIIKDHPDSGSAWLLHHRTAAPGHSFQAFLLETSKSWAPATIVQLQKMLTKRCCTATTINIISCCFKEGEIRSALNIKKISKQQMAEPQIRQKESTQRAMDIKVPMEPDGQQLSNAALSQHDIFQAATLHSGSSSLKTSDISQIEIQRKAVRIIKKNEHLNWKDEPLLKKSVQRQQSLKDASGAYKEDGNYIKRQRLLVSREKTGSINRPQYKMRGTQDDNKEDLSGKIIAKQAESRHPEGERETEKSHTNTIENGNQKRLAYILQADSTHKADNNDVDHKQMLTEVGEEVLIMVFLPDTEREAQTERKLILNTDTGWKTVNIPIKQLEDPPPMTEVMKENFNIETDNSKCQCLTEILFSVEIHALDRTEGIDIKPAESAAKVTTASAYTEEQTAEMREIIEHTETNDTPHENMSINNTKQEENVPSEESVIPSPPSLKMIKTETAKTELMAETTTVNMEIKDTTLSSEVFNQDTTQNADGLPRTEETPVTTMSPGSETEPRFITWETNNNVQAPTEKLFSGLRMREDVLADITKLHKGAEDGDRAATNRPANERQEDQKDSKVNSFRFAKPSQIIHKQATDTLPKTTDDNMPLCRGLIHRTKAGWKHCVERFAGMGSKMFSSMEPAAAFTDTEEEETTSIRDHKDSPLSDDEYDHFYYFDGILRRVQNNFYPDYKRQKRQKRNHDNAENNVFTMRKKGDTENLSFIKRLTLRKKASHLKWSGRHRGTHYYGKTGPNTVKN
ncbi:uncharacterized protein LOC127370259 [Dicentrarchus labrax]|uniref:uncharacterized protein LOC127370259 n=1 Tax=Dicentrarchus labrax TaxID=13489 RepID=UPI0021F5AE70|nr:uncharacterized protein LOC127370259 [Dicentrarchus labrax]